jgi:carboxymethylenebutenolidase
MTESTVSRIDVQTADGVMDVHLHAAGGTGAAPTVVFYPDAGGVRPVMQQMAAQLAATGYLVALPNIYYRAGAFAPFDVATVFTDPAERSRLDAVNSLATKSAVMADTAALLDALAALPAASVARVGCVGYCRGGYLAFAAAGAHPDRVVAAASVHGGRLATAEPDSPHHQAGAIRATLYFGIADDDPTCTPEMQTRLRAALDTVGVAYDLERYPGAAHGFAVPDNPTYDPAAAQRHWDRLRDLFARALPAA